MMSEPRRGLGRGLSALLGEEAAAPQAGVKSVPIERLHPGRFQPRVHFDEDALEALAQSIATQGVLQPLLVRPLGDDYEILAGERRWRAAQKARLHEVPVLVREVGDRDALELALVENVQREDLGALEEAAGYQRLIAEFDYTQDALAQRVGKSRSHVANMIRLLGLPLEVRALVEGRKLSAGHARALLTAKDPVALAREAVRHGMSVRQVERAAQRSVHEKDVAAGAAKAPRDPNVAALEKELAMILGMRVTVAVGAEGRGTLAIHYRTLDQLDDLVARLKITPQKS
ncbi:MAG TPA: ParB/RepB/Spo0J family partition protein [Stellaceae bacterium]|nr:ParB/RepB/Spo0J family partition protein [Stellaceae bacterium]